MKPYASDVPVDWMNLTASDWIDRYLPGWRERSYGDLMRASPSDWFGWIYPQYAGAGAGAAVAKHPVYDVPRHGQDVPRHGHAHPHGCRCRDCAERKCQHCGPDPCACVCCIGEVDLVVYARVGEQRVIPIVVENERRREKSITVELSAWRTRGGGAAPVDTVSVEPKTFTLPPCGEREIVVVTRTRPPEAAPGPDQATDVRPEQRELKDVDGCLVVTADLTLVGCDHRPIRIAIAILPRDCEPFRIPCGCACC